MSKSLFRQKNNRFWVKILQIRVEIKQVRSHSLRKRRVILFPLDVTLGEYGRPSVLEIRKGFFRGPLLHLPLLLQVLLHSLPLTAPQPPCLKNSQFLAPGVHQMGQGYGGAGRDSRWLQEAVSG